MKIPAFILENPEGIFEYPFDITEKYTDGNHQMRTGDFARMMEEITERHLSYYGVRQELQADGHKTWVILWSQMEIERKPEYGEKVILRMWPGKMKVGMYTRKYGLYTAEGEKLAGVGSMFAIMNLDTRTIGDSVPAVQKMPVCKLSDEPELPKMMMQFPENLSEQTARTVKKEELDKNGHLNNAHYLDWIDELAAMSGHHQVMKVWVRYDHELRENDIAVLNYKWEENQLYVSGESMGKTSFTAIMTYKD